MQKIHDFANQKERLQMERKLYRKYGKTPNIGHYPKIFPDNKIKNELSGTTSPSDQVKQASPRQRRPQTTKRGIG